jgi:FixJ family two-component response regulator
MGVVVQSYQSAEEFLAAYSDQPGCIVTDYRLGGMNGIELQQELLHRGFGAPVIIVTAHARTSLAVRAMKAGALTVFDKPYEDDALWEAICEALAQDAERRKRQRESEEIRRRFDSLNAKEIAVLDLLVQGKQNKTMAQQLDVSLRTIENRRRSVFAKLGVGSVAELVTLKVLLECDPDSPSSLRRPNSSPIAWPRTETECERF